MTQRQKVAPAPQTTKPQKFEVEEKSKTKNHKELCNRIDKATKAKKTDIREVHTCKRIGCGCEYKARHRVPVYRTKRGRYYTLVYSNGWVDPTTIYVNHSERAK